MDPDIRLLLESLRQQVAGNPDLREFDIVSMAEPSIRLSTRRVSSALIGVGESRIGGVPDVPPGFEWPRWAPNKERDDKFGGCWKPSQPKPLGFIAQFDLSELPQVDDSVPKTGWLYFFYDRYSEPWGFDPNDRGCCHVVYANCGRETLLRIEPPEEADPGHTAPVCAIEAWPEITLPDEFSDLGYGTQEFDAYQRQKKSIQSDSMTIHRLFGHPQLIQNPMELECQLASNGVFCGEPAGFEGEKAKALEAGAADWRLFLQIDTDDDGPGWMWGDVGRIYFWVKRQDLQSQRFDDVWLIFQCC